jgi:hypothetical protein
MSKPRTNQKPALRGLAASEIAALPVEQQRLEFLKDLDRIYDAALARCDDDGRPDPDLGTALDVIEAAGRVLGVLPARNGKDL